MNCWKKTPLLVKLIIVLIVIQMITSKMWSVREGFRRKEAEGIVRCMWKGMTKGSKTGDVEYKCSTIDGQGTKSSFKCDHKGDCKVINGKKFKIPEGDGPFGFTARDVIKTVRDNVEWRV